MFNVEFLQIRTADYKIILFKLKLKFCAHGVYIYLRVFWKSAVDFY